MTLKLYNPDDRYESDDQLIEAIEEADVERVRQRLAGGSDADSLDGRQFSALMMAAERGYHKIFCLLLDAGADPYFNVRGYHALDAAVAFGHTDIVREWIGRGLQTESADRSWTSLISAATHGNTEAIELLLNAGANVNLADAHHHTPLWWAMVNDCSEAANLLRAAGGVVDEPDGESAEFNLPPMQLVDLATLAGSNRFQSWIADANERRGCQLIPSQSLEGVYEPDTELAVATIAQLAGRARKSGFLFVYTKFDYPTAATGWSLFPTNETSSVLSAMETNGENYGISTRRIAAALNNIEQRQPLDLLGVGFDFVDWQFQQPVDDSFAMANEIYDLCPDAVEQGSQGVAELANMISQTHRVFLWWD